MIKVSFIAPTKLMHEYGSRGDFNLVLAHLLDDKDYLFEVIDSGLPIYLDNGLFENGVSVPLEELIDKALELDAEYVFAPDVLYNRKETEENIGKAYEMLEEKKKLKPLAKTKLAAVVQADNRKDYLESYQAMVEDERVDLIGLSILSIPKSFQEVTGTDNISLNRIHCLLDLEKMSVHKDCHLLGAGSSYLDVDYARKYCHFVKSHDSSSAIWNAIQGHRLKGDLLIEGGKTEVPVDFKWNVTLLPRQIELLKNNIEIVKRVCK